MSKARNAVWTVAGIVILGSVGLAGYKGYERYRERTAKKEAEGGRKESSLRVSCTKVRLGDVTVQATLTGTVRAMAEVDVTAKVSGRLERLRLEDGTAVDEGLVIEKAGVLIAVIDHKQLQAAADEAAAAVAAGKASVKVATAALKEAEEVVKDAERERKRQEELYGKDGVTAQARDRAVSTHERALASKLAAESRVVQAESGVVQAEAALERASVVLDEAFVRAPIAGVVARKYLDEGNTVSSVPATPIVKIVDMGTVKVVVGVNEEDVGKLVAGKTQVCVAAESGGKQCTVAVAKIGVTSDPVTHTVEVELHVPNADYSLRPGSFARVEVELGKKKGVPVIGESAVVRRGGETYVFVVKESRAHQRSVRLGLSEGSDVEVTSGVSAGELLVTSGHRLLKEGDAVEVEGEGDGGVRKETK